MDCRLTLNRNDSFLSMLQNSYSSNEKVFLLFEDNSLTRAEGLIKTVDNDTRTPTVELENGCKIQIQNILAVNGIFSPEFGEC